MLPLDLKILFSNLTLMDISFEASKMKMVDLASKVGFQTKYGKSAVRKFLHSGHVTSIIIAHYDTMQPI